MDKLLIGIVLTVYPRPDGRSHWYLQRCLKSIRAQTYKNYKLFVIGDKYGRKVKGDFYYEDLPYAYERDKYTGHRLWCCGGTNAINHGIKKIVENGIDYIIMMDYDDYWYPEHLQSFAEAGYFDWACTKSRHINNRVWPQYNGKEKIFDFIPTPRGLVKTSACYNIKRLPFTIRNVYEETGHDRAPDWDLWFRMRKYIQENPQMNFKCIGINKITCVHDEQGYAKEAFKW